MMFFPQRNGSVGAVLINTGTVSGNKVRKEGELEPSNTVTNQPCRDVTGGTGGAHLIKQVCPQLQSDIRESIATIVRNERVTGGACPSGMAHLRSGGNADLSNDYVCTPNAGATNSRK